MTRLPALIRPALVVAAAALAVSGAVSTAHAAESKTFACDELAAVPGFDSPTVFTVSGRRCDAPVESTYSGPATAKGGGKTYTCANVEFRGDRDFSPKDSMGHSLTDTVKGGPGQDLDFSMQLRGTNCTQS
ncbi:hypothetical protein [Streptomyces sp. RKAG337]|uniref:hypothetical protein n=1 Tax=Streptomyces sp. RKAG337 TaxID=2893404 RepID=UPI0020346D9A|nr:hypothetical protein [Streptomyces sp. RKAG337]MCM2425082.1 hypothetical protein [Streptomyces sp. RKAG337]